MESRLIISLMLWHHLFRSVRIDWVIRSHLRVYALWWSFHIEIWGAPSEVRPLGKLLVSHCSGLSGEREMLEFFRINGRCYIRCGIYFTSIPLSVIQFNWNLVCRSKGFRHHWEEFSQDLRRYHHYILF